MRDRERQTAASVTRYGTRTVAHDHAARDRALERIRTIRRGERPADEMPAALRALRSARARLRRHDELRVVR
jgi:hypothetical protein